MAKNKFDIQVIMNPEGDVIQPIFGEILPGFNINQLPKIHEKVNLNTNLRLRILGDIDVRNIINKNSKFDDTCFPYLVICGNFYCSKYSKNFPRVISKTFDCSGLGKDYITKDTFLPLADEINCAYSITDFDVLMDILPERLKTLVVEQKLIKKSFLMQDKKHLETTLAFIEKYPDLTVLDTNGNNLINVLQEIDQELDEKKLQKKYAQIKEIKTATQEIKETFEIKIKGKHLEVREILAYFRTLSEYDSYSDDAMERMIRCVLSDQRKNGIQKKYMQRADGVKVICIDVSQIELVRQDIITLIQERSKEKTEEKIETVSAQKQEIPKQQSVKRMPIEIKKYIKASQLKEIKKSSGEQKANAVLSAINEINLDPLEMQFQGAVHIVKDGRETVSGTVKKELGCCIVQSIDSSNHDDTKRVVWRVANGPTGLIIVCVGFLEHHNTKRASNVYENLRNQAKKMKTYTEQNLSEYINVQELISDCNDYDTAFPKNNVLMNKVAEILNHVY